MINTSEVIDAIIAALQAMPDLVTYLGGDPIVIRPYYDAFPVENNISDVVNNAKAPSLLVSWQGTESGVLQFNEAWKHKFSLWIRCAPSTTPENPYSKLQTLIMNGVPDINGNDQPFKRYQFHPDLYELNPTKSGDYKFIRIVNGTEDFWQLQLTFTEIGDI